MSYEVGRDPRYNEPGNTDESRVARQSVRFVIVPCEYSGVVARGITDRGRRQRSGFSVHGVDYFVLTEGTGSRYIGEEAGKRRAAILCTAAEAIIPARK